MISVETTAPDCGFYYAKPVGKVCTLAEMREDDSKIIKANSKLFPIINRSAKTVCVHKNADIAELKPVQTGRRLRAMDLQHIQDYDDDNMDKIIREQAEGGISLPKLHDSIKFDDKYYKTLAGHMGEYTIQDDEPSHHDVISNVNDSKVNPNLSNH